MKSNLRVLILLLTMPLWVHADPIADPKNPQQWLAYAAQQVDQIPDPDCKDEILGHLARCQGRSGDIQGANKSAVAIKDVYSSFLLHLSIAECSYQQGNLQGFKDSMNAARTLAQNNTTTYDRYCSGIVQTYLDCNECDQALVYLATKPQDQYLDLAYSSIATHMAHQGRWAEAERLVPNKSRQPQAVWTYAAEYCLSKQQLDTAAQLARHVTEKKWRDRVYTKLGLGYARAGELPAARHSADQVEEPVGRSRVLAAIACELIERGVFEEAQQISTLITDRDSLNTVDMKRAQVQSQRGDPNAVAALVQDMTTRIEQTPQTPDRSKFGVFDDSVKKGAAQMVYLNAALTYHQNGDTQAYQQSMQKALQGVLDMNVADLWKGTYLNQIVDIQIQAQDLTGARQTIQHFQNEHTRGWSLYHLVQAQCDQNDIDAAIQSYQDIIDPMNKSFACETIASRLIKQDLLKQAEELMLTLGHSAREAQTYIEVAVTMIETDHSQGLTTWLQRIPTPQARVCTCIGAVRGLIQPQTPVTKDPLDSATN